MTLEYAGKTDFEFGINSAGERNALDAADDRPDNTGATLDGSIKTVGWLDKQVLNRYGIKMHALPDDSEATLRKFLTTPGYAFLLQGSMGNLPVGHPLRRWEPQFGGGHAVCVITGTQPRWLDPLGPKGFAGDLADIDTVLRFAWDGAKYSRYMKKDELASIPDTGTEGHDLYIREVLYSRPRLMHYLAGEHILAYKPPSHVVVHDDVLKRSSRFYATGEAFVVGWAKDPTEEWEYWLCKDGGNAGLYVAKNPKAVEPLEPVPSIAVDVAAAKNQASAARDAAWESWVATRPKGS